MKTLLAIAALVSSGCAIGPRVVVHHALRCEVQPLLWTWADGTTSVSAINVCRYGPVGRVPDPAETGDPYVKR